MKRRTLGRDGPVVPAIPGGTAVAHPDDNVPAADLDEIERAFATIAIEGAPLSAALDAAIDR